MTSHIREPEGEKKESKLKKKIPLENHLNNSNKGTTGREGENCLCACALSINVSSLHLRALAPGETLCRVTLAPPVCL